MLISLHVKNLALISETEVTFGEGLNILSGETGAGKSIIIGSINLALGARADKDLIRTGADYALVELVFQVTDDAMRQSAEAMEIPVEDDGIIIIQRKIQPGRNLFKICGETVTAKQIRALSELLIDIHGQHEHQSLLYKRNHMEILDSFAGEELAVIREELRERYQQYGKLKKELAEFCVDDGVKAKELSLAEFEYQEIEEAGLTAGEDEALERDYRKMANSRQIVEAADRAYQLTGNGERRTRWAMRCGNSAAWRAMTTGRRSLPTSSRTSMPCSVILTGRSQSTWQIWSLMERGLPRWRNG